MPPLPIISANFRGTFARKLSFRQRIFPCASASPWIRKKRPPMRWFIPHAGRFHWFTEGLMKTAFLLMNGCKNTFGSMKYKGMAIPVRCMCREILTRIRKKIWCGSQCRLCRRKAVIFCNTLYIF
ncbi:hypothetical protein KL86CLO1_12336 [uncultured Eubacteriales bacterium]|uniref:Uncharacterized protein n=1 Tax=uncultured Eubacteriales bacterium TaxID=172733 RepID=A0A212K7N1_9FIRM|nr:hypothetical protein KL86CLO1_12336 [uncultured Eubacteriales bacterium]